MSQHSLICVDSEGHQVGDPISLTSTVVRVVMVDEADRSLLRYGFKLRELERADLVILGGKVMKSRHAHVDADLLVTGGMLRIMIRGKAANRRVLLHKTVNLSGE
jgi:hypothetical protein